jgi:nitrous oxidase accessory protein NosD
MKTTTHLGRFTASLALVAVATVGASGAASAADTPPAAGAAVTAAPTQEPTPAPDQTTAAQPDQTSAETTPAAPAPTPAPAAAAPEPPPPAAPAGPAPAPARLLGAAPITNAAADAVKVAWVDADTTSPQPAALPYTLQQALDAAGANGGVVHVADGVLGYAKVLTVKADTTVVSANGTSIAALWSIATDGVTFTQGGSVALTGTPANGKSVVTVASGKSGVTLNDIDITANASSTGTTGLLINGTNGTTVNRYTFDAGTSGGYGISARTASGVVVNGATMTNVSMGYFMHGSETVAAGPKFTDVNIDAYGAYGIQLGNAAGATFTDVTITGSGGQSTVNSGAVDLGSTTSAVFTDVNLSGYGYGIKQLATATGAGTTVTRAKIDAALIAVATGKTDGVSLTDVKITGGKTNVNTSLGIEGAATGLTLTRVSIDGYYYGARSTAASGSGFTATDLSIKKATFGLVIGGLSDATLTDVTIDADGVTPAGTTYAVQAGAAAANLTASGLTVKGAYSNGIGVSGTTGSSDWSRSGITVTDSTFTGAGTAVAVANASTVIVERITATLAEGKGSGVSIRNVNGLTVSDSTINGSTTTTYQSGTNGIRSYFSQDVTVRDTVLTDGTTGLYWDTTTGVTVERVTVSGADWYGNYTEMVADYVLTESVFTDNAAIANLTINPSSTASPRDVRAVSRDIRWSASRFTGNGSGIYLAKGLTGFEFDHNAVSGTGTYVIGAFPAHDVHVHDNTIDYTGEQGAVMVGTDSYSNLDAPDDYASSAITVTGNTFTGAGAFVRVGSSGGQQTALSDDSTVLVVGNVFPADSVAIDTRSNAGGRDGVAVDARDHATANNWGSVCKATNEHDGYLGGGAAITQVGDHQVLYPVNCIDLSVTEGPASAGTAKVGDTVSWTLEPHNDGLTAAPAGWSVTQILPTGIELVSMTGAGYTFDGLTATSSNDLERGQDGPPITVKVRIVDVAWTQGEATRALPNVAFVSPLAADNASDRDGDGFADVIIENLNPLAVPTITTDTFASATNNDTQGVVSAVRGASKVVVEHYIAGSFTPVCDEVTMSDFPGEAYTTTACNPAGYHLVATPANASGLFPGDGDTTLVIYLYAKDFAPVPPIPSDPIDPTAPPTPAGPTHPTGLRDPLTPVRDKPKQERFVSQVLADDGRLASTGSSAGPVAALAGLLTLSGAAVVALARRARPTDA